jgi:putative sterol carrier protein
MGKDFNPDAAKGVDAVFQFEISGEDGGNWFIVIKDGSCHIEEGKHDSPTATMTISDETWIKMSNKELTGMKAFMTGKLKTKGNMMMAQRMDSLFPR